MDPQGQVIFHARLDIEKGNMPCGIRRRNRQVSKADINLPLRWSPRPAGSKVEVWKPATLSKPLQFSDPYIKANMLFLVVQFIKIFTNQAMLRSKFFHRYTTGDALISAIPFKIHSLSSSLLDTRICRKKVRAIFENAVSIKFNHEPCLGVCT